MSHGMLWHRCQRWWRFGFSCPFGAGEPGPPADFRDIQTQPEQHEGPDHDDGDDDGIPFPGAPERRQKRIIQTPRHVMDMVNEVLEAMARREERVPVTARVPAMVPDLARRSMAEAVKATGGRMSPGSVEQLLTRFASDRVRKAIKGRSREIDFSGGALRAVGAAGAVAGGGFIFDFVRKMKLRGGVVPGGGGGGGFGSGQQG